MKKIIISAIIIIILALIMIYITNKRETFKNDSREQNETIIPTISYIIKGTYEYDPGMPTTRFAFYFKEDGNVIFASDSINYGKYVIKGETINISYYKTILGDGAVADFVRKDDTLTIKDNDTLVGIDGKEFRKMSENTDLDF